MTESEELHVVLSQSIGFLLARSQRLVQKRVDQALKPLKLSLKEYVVLRLVGMKVKLSQGALGETYGIDGPTMVSLTDRLEKEGLLERHRSLQDRRTYTLNLTVKGNKVVARAARLVSAQQNEFLSPLSEQETDQLRQLLWRLVKAHDENLQSP